MRGYYLSSRAPRRGQALLLAVLIMIFAALLSASFIAVVSVNLNQTARQADKSRAFASAAAGLNYINRQLTFSDAGERWFEANYPATTLAGYTSNPLYYTALDRAQGWAGSFAKFPDPNTPQGEGPLFLAKVERLPNVVNLTSPDADRRDPNKAGMLRITIIGLSADDPSAYHTLIRYKGGFHQAPIAQTMRVVSNWDFKNGVVPVGQVTGTYNTTTRQVTLTNVRGEFPATPFTVMIGDPRTAATPRSAVVTAVAAVAGGTQLTLAVNPTVSPVANERIEVAATLGAPRAVDFDNSGGTIDTVGAANSETITVKIADDVSAGVTSAGGIRANGGLALSGYVAAEALRSITNNSSTQPPASIRASGIITKNTENLDLSRITLTGQGITTSPANLLNSDEPSFPFASGVTGTTKDQLVSDGWHRLLGTAGITGTRNVSNFQPPALDSRENLERYRNLTRFSRPNADALVGFTISPATSAQSLHGYAEGIYIDNAEDKEKIYSGTALREMTQTEFINMLLSQPVPATATPVSYMRTGAPALPTALDASLEQQRLRGWVGPDEFRARGVEIELGNNSITITRDARDDNRATNPDGTVGTSNALGSVAAKTWKDPVNGAPLPGVYSRTFAWPTNGVIFAEGNVRIRGNATNALRSLTVVSMGNIYIEDSLSINNHPTTGRPQKPLLLAKKNVVMNPTRVLGRPDAQTTARSAVTLTANTGATLQVADAASFQVGDLIGASTVAGGVETIAQGLITSRTATPSTTDNDTITVTSFTITSTTTMLPLVVTLPPTFTFSSGTLIRTPTSAPQATTTAPFVSFAAIASTTDVMQRRINTPAALTDTNPLRLAFNHSGDRPTTNIFRVRTSPQSTANVWFSHKRVLNGGAYDTAAIAATTVSDANKVIRGDYTAPTTGTDTFPNPAASQTLNTISTVMNNNPPHGTGGWQYQTNLTAAYANVPFHYLVGVGNRFEYGVAPVAANDRRLNVNTSSYLVNSNITLATSISILFNGLPRSPINPIVNENWNTALTTTDKYDKTMHFGFNPAYAPATLPEDILTADRSFYRAEASQTTLDSRTLPPNNSLTAYPAISPLILRQSDGLVAVGAAAPLPAYRMRGIKIENVALTASSSNVNTIDPAHTFNVNAFVYAQTGSWFVIPGGLFEPRLRGDATQNYLDINDNNAPNPGEYLDAGTIGTYDAGDYADLNRNGLLEDPERYAMARYSRYNYSINFTGAIAENQTALVNSVASNALPVGGVNSWMTSWVTTQKAAGATTTTFDRMKYRFDPTIAMGGLQQDDPSTAAYEADTGFRLPQTTDLVSTS